MTTIALVATLAGLTLSLAGAAWIQWGINPHDPQFSDEGDLFPGPQRSKVLPRYIKAQQRPTLLVVIGGGVQIVGGVLAVIAL